MNSYDAETERVHRVARVSILVVVLCAILLSSVFAPPRMADFLIGLALFAAIIQRDIVDFILFLLE